MDELHFVDFLKRHFKFQQGIGIGDDCSVVKTSRGYQLITTDLLIEDIHFKIDFFSPLELALKSLAVNLSDVAAMGGIPEYFYLSLGFPDRLSVDYLTRFFRGIKKGCQKWQVALAGGDYSRSGLMVIAITVVGRAIRPVLRSTARAGDWIGITARTGESALGLQLLLRNRSDPYFSNRHKKVEPELRKGAILSRYANAMIDVSDGLLLDLERLLAASGLGGEIDIEKIPVSRRFQRICRSQGLDANELILAGGEDYCLLFTVAPSKEFHLKKSGLSYHRIGKVTAGRGVRIVERGKPLVIHSHGYDHFRQARFGEKK